MFQKGDQIKKLNMKVAGTLPSKPVNSEKPANWDQMTAKQKKNFKKKLQKKKKKLERSQVMSASSVASDGEDEQQSEAEDPDLDLNFDVALDDKKTQKPPKETAGNAESEKDGETQDAPQEPEKTRRGPKISNDV